jgi:hypothetical protein
MRAYAIFYMLCSGTFCIICFDQRLNGYTNRAFTNTKLSTLWQVEEVKFRSHLI